MKTKIFLSIIFLSLYSGVFFVFEVFSLRIWVPYDNERDILIKREIITNADSQDSFINAIRLINSYLRFIVAAICMGVIIYAGFLMITGRWDEAQVKKGVLIMTYAGIGVWIALMAYAIVNVIVNFFGSG